MLHPSHGMAARLGFTFNTKVYRPYIAEGGADPPFAPSTTSRHGERCVQQHSDQAVIKNCPVSVGMNKATFHEYQIKLGVGRSLYSNPVFEVFQGKVQPSSTPSSADTSTLDVIAERTWTQANQDLWSLLLLSTSSSANNTVKSIEGTRPEMARGTDRRRGRFSRKNTTATLKEARRASHE